MHDENKSFAHANQLSDSLERLRGGLRPIKKAKTLTVRVPCGELAQAQALEKSTLLTANWPIYVRKRNDIPPANIEKLPPEIVHHILGYLPLADVGRLSQTSTRLNNIVCSWLETNRIQKRIARLIEQTNSPSTSLNGRLLLPHELHSECKRVGNLLKMLTCLAPTSQRLALYFHFIQKLKAVIQQKIPDIKSHVISSINGVTLHALIAGWDKRECRTVFHTLRNFYNIPSDINCYPDHCVEGINEKYYTIRIFIRSHFLDFCAWQDRTLWIHLVFDELNVKTPIMAANVLLLLYAPLGRQGMSPWVLMADEDPTMSADYYKVLGESLVRLTGGSLINYMPFVELFHCLTSIPNVWSLRAQASLLLCAYFHDNKPVVPYFKQLAVEKCDDLLVGLLTEIIAVANDFLTVTAWNDCLEPVTNRSVLKLILSALSAGWGHEELTYIVNELWKDVRDLANDLLDGAALLGCTEDVDSLMATWKNIGINLKF